MNQPNGGQFSGGQYGQPPYGAQPPAAPPYGAQPGYPQAQPGYPQQQPGYPPAQPGYPAQQGFPGGQPGYPQQQQQQPGAQGGFGRIVLQSSYFFMAWRLGRVPMTVFVDGAPSTMQWGQTPLDVPAGQHQIAIQGDYRGRRTIGQAQTVVQVMPGQQQMLYYRAPALATSPGSVGPNPKQPTNGLALSLAISFVPLVIIIILMIVTLAT
ncbi:MAG TPA: hypothetical protein VHX38_29905 [Pseudonocardiaceae bacterium]|jgi:hypothetical protein|nr:hypothetical protein [Pseudonocardiaceae bacterium]